MVARLVSPLLLLLAVVPWSTHAARVSNQVATHAPSDAVTQAAADAPTATIHWKYFFACYWTSAYTADEVKASCAWHNKEISIGSGGCPPGDDVFEAVDRLGRYPDDCGAAVAVTPVAPDPPTPTIHWTYFFACYWTSKYTAAEVKASCAWHDKIISIGRGDCPPGANVYEAVDRLGRYPDDCGAEKPANGRAHVRDEDLVLVKA